MQAPPAASSAPYQSALLNELHTLFPALLYDPGRFSSVGQLTHYIAEQARAAADVFSQQRRAYHGWAAAAAAPPNPLEQQASPIQPSRRFVSRSSAAAALPLRTPPPLRRSGAAAAAAPASRPPPQDEYTMTLESEDASGNRIRVETNPILLSPGTAAAATLRPPSRRAAAAVATPSLLSPDATGIETLLATMLGLGGLTDGLDALLSPIQAVAGTGLQAPAGFTADVPVVPTEEQIAAASLLFTHLAGQPDTACAVCQDDIREGESVRKIRHCEHTFHRSCIDAWFQRDVHCPVCRFDIRETDAQEE